MKAASHLFATVFICSKDMGFGDPSEFHSKDRYEYVNEIYRKVIPAYRNLKAVEDLTAKEYDMLGRHNMESAVSLAYKMLGSESTIDNGVGLSGDVILMLKLIRYLHGHRVPPELVPGFLLLLVKHHFYK